MINIYTNMIKVKLRLENQKKTKKTVGEFNDYKLHKIFIGNTIFVT